MKIDGRAIADEILNELRNRIQRLKEKGVTPHLAIILVGDSPESKSYVEQKELKGNNIGVKISVKNLPSNITQEELLKVIEQLDSDKNIHGIIIQRPLPENIKKEAIEKSIDTKKDVDGFNPVSPHNPPISEAVLRLLEHIFSSNKIVDQDLKSWLNSQTVIILGKGETGGYPIIRTFEKLGINFQIIDSRTESPENITKNADIVISAVGKPYTLNPEKIKKGVVLIGVGLSKDNGKLKGDYSGKEIKEIASFYTPTPGGVGPVNVAMLLKNLVEAAENYSS